MRLLCRVLAVMLAACVCVKTAAAQGVTTASISGIVTDADRKPIPGANVMVVHGPSGTRYTTQARADGRLSIPGMRVGGPYRVTVAMIGFGTLVQDNVFLALGTATDLEFVLREIAVTLDEVVVTGVFSSERTGAATVVNIEDLKRIPPIGRSLGGFARLTPQASGASFVGQDNRLNNVTVDGAYFNNSFGLAGGAAGR